MVEVSGKKTNKIHEIVSRISETRCSPRVRCGMHEFTMAQLQVAFYESLYSHPNLVAHCPLFLGTKVLKTGRKDGVKDEPQRDRGCEVMICLEDLTARYSRPCICDVKMGNIQHGHTASDAKRARSLKKCRQTTSLKLGFRLCGMKVWQAHRDEYKSVDKYHGRRVRASKIDAEVASFFDDGVMLRSDAIAAIEAKVASLLETMRQHEAHRFYSASMLLIYEGDPHAPPQCDVRLIDFAHTALVSEIPSMQGQRGPDNGLLLGLLRFDEILLRLLDGGHRVHTEDRNTEGTTTTTDNDTTDNNVGFDEDTTDWTDFGGDEECSAVLESPPLTSKQHLRAFRYPFELWDSDHAEVTEFKKTMPVKKTKKPTKKIRKHKKDKHFKVHRSLDDESGESESWAESSEEEAEEESEIENIFKTSKPAF